MFYQDVVISIFEQHTPSSRYHTVIKYLDADPTGAEEVNKNDQTCWISNKHYDQTVVGSESHKQTELYNDITKYQIMMYKYMRDAREPAPLHG